MNRALPVLAALSLLAGAAHAQLVIVNNVPGTFEDISGTGTPLNLTDNGKATVVLPIVNLVFQSTLVTISNNLAVGFGGAAAGSNAAPVNTAIPGPGLFGGAQSLAPMWDNPGANLPAANVYYQVFSDHYTIMWKDLPKAGGTVSAQLQVFGGSPRRTEIYAQFLYTDVQQPNVRNIATIGYQDGNTGFNDVQWSFNDPNAIQNGTILTLMLPAPAAAGLLVPGLILAARRRR